LVAAAASGRNVLGDAMTVADRGDALPECAARNVRPPTNPTETASKPQIVNRSIVRLFGIWAPDAHHSGGASIGRSLGNSAMATSAARSPAGRAAPTV
jgi:hypothetical protein